MDAPIHVRAFAGHFPSNLRVGGLNHLLIAVRERPLSYRRILGISLRSNKKPPLPFFVAIAPVSIGW